MILKIESLRREVSKVILGVSREVVQGKSEKGKVSLTSPQKPILRKGGEGTGGVGAG
jgi:hypothetical protein